jgi:F-type H+-transporting ATPase subunit delta
MTDRADRYAAAILEVARAEDAVERVTDELFRFSRALVESDRLRQTLSDIALPAEKRQAIVEDVLGPRAHSLTTSLVSFIVAAGRARSLPDIIERTVERAAAEREREMAEVRSAIPLDDDQQARLARALSDALGKQVEVRVVVDKAVMGGLVARVGDTVIDGTVRRRLDQLREAL